MRRLVSGLLILCFLLWGPLEMLPLALAARPARAAVSTAKIACVCPICAARRANPKACCCAKAHTAAEKLVMQAQCENHPDTALVVKARLPLTLPPAFVHPVCPVYVFSHVFTYVSLLRVLIAELSDPPPCHA